MKFKIVYNAWWMRKGWAMVFFFWMWVGKDEKDFADWHFRHELQHCYQVKREGRLKFYIKYLYYWVRHGMFWGGYRNNPYEIEANERENDPLTDEEKQWKANGKIIL